MVSYNVEEDLDKNRLYLTLEGLLDEDEANEAIDELLGTADRMAPGFDLVNDIQGFKPLSQDATDVLERGREGLVDRGMSGVVRAVGDSSLSNLQFERILNRPDGLYVDTAETRTQAELLLDDVRVERK